MTLTKYLIFRLGGLSGATAGLHMILRPFGANTLKRFWQLWNPVFGYYLLVFVYTPARRILPRPIAFAATFGVSGFAHDVVVFLPIWAAAGEVMFPMVTVAFFVVSVIVLISEAVHLNLQRLPPGGRAIVHLTMIGVSLAISMLLSGFMSGSGHS